MRCSVTLASLTGRLLLGRVAEVAAELVEHEDVAVLTRESAQLAVELRERVIGFDEVLHLQVLLVVVAGLGLRGACGRGLRQGELSPAGTTNGCSLSLRSSFLLQRNIVPPGFEALGVD